MIVNNYLWFNFPINNPFHSYVPYLPQLTDLDLEGNLQLSCLNLVQDQAEKLSNEALVFVTL